MIIASVFNLILEKKKENYYVLIGLKLNLTSI